MGIDQSLAHDLNLAGGLAQIRQQFKVPGAFAADVLDDASRAATRALDGHVDRTDWPFVTLDPASSTDLDQAFHLVQVGSDLLLHYAIADVAWFVDDDGPMDREAWIRGTTQYLPDGRSSLYPPTLSEAAASLLPSGPRPAVVFHVRVDGQGNARLDGVERSIIQSRAKLAYDTVRADQLPTQFEELQRRIAAAEIARGASRIDAQEQSVEAVSGSGSGSGSGFRLVFRPRLASEDANAAMSLATNLAVADALYAAKTGLFRVMPEPDDRAVKRLRHTAAAFGLQWDPSVPLAEFERQLNGADQRQAAFMMAVRRAGGGARYVPFDPAVRPWHAAMAATYAHATAPLRRLADRYVVMAALELAQGRTINDRFSAAFQALPAVMERADATSSQIERAVVDLAEASLLADQVGNSFQAVVTDVDDRGARIQLRDIPVVTRVAAHSVAPGDELTVKLADVQVDRRTANFVRVA